MVFYKDGAAHSFVCLRPYIRMTNLAVARLVRLVLFHGIHDLDLRPCNFFMRLFQENVFISHSISNLELNTGIKNSTFSVIDNILQKAAKNNIFWLFLLFNPDGAHVKAFKLIETNFLSVQNMREKSGMQQALQKLLQFQTISCLERHGTFID